MLISRCVPKMQYACVCDYLRDTFGVWLSSILFPDLRVWEDLPCICLWMTKFTTGVVTADE